MGNKIFKRMVFACLKNNLDLPKLLLHVYRFRRKLY